jgi:CheY-like chemotaxis protein
MPTPKVLVIARDEIITSLLSTLIEAAGDGAVFAEAGEDVVVAMRRLRPHIVLLEADVRVARDETAFQAVYHRMIADAATESSARRGKSRGRRKIDSEGT